VVRSRGVRSGSRCEGVAPPSVSPHQQLTEGRLGLGVLAFTVVDVTDGAGCVHEVLGRPVVVLIAVAGAVVVVHGDRVAHPKLCGGSGDVPDFVFEGELRDVDAHNGEPAPCGGGVPRLHMGQRPLAVDERVGPEVDQDNPIVEAGDGQGPITRSQQPARDLGESMGRPALLPRRAGRHAVGQGTAGGLSGHAR
jgi:hypothetical protein